MEEFKLKASADDLDLAVAIFKPQEGTRVRGVIQVVHGMVEHKERYFDFLEWISSKGYVAVIHDNRGHGASVKSQKDLGFFYDGGWLAAVNDIKIVGDYARELYPNLPFTLLGHSMGSMLVRSYTKRYDSTINTLFVIGCPTDNPAKGIGKILAMIYGTICGWHFRPALLQKLSFGKFNKRFQSEGWPSAWICSDPDVLVEYHNNPLCQYRFTANGFYNLLCLMTDCYSRKGWKMENPQMPVHFISGGDDPCASSPKALEAAAALMRDEGYSNTTLKVYEGLRHEVLKERSKEEIWDYILKRMA